MSNVVAHPTYRPEYRASPFNKVYADIVLEGLHNGVTLRETCRMERKNNPDFPSPSVFTAWYVWQVDASYVDRYAQARRAQAQHMFEEIIDIADNGQNDWMERRRKDGTIDTKVDNEATQRSKLRIETRKWILSKMAPDLFGERFQIQQLGADGKPIDPSGSQSQIDLQDALKGWSAKTRAEAIDNDHGM